MSRLTRSTAKALSVSPTEDSPLPRNTRGVTPDVSRTPLRNTPVKLRTRRASLADTPQDVVSSPLRRSRRLSTNFDETTTPTKLRNLRTIRTNHKLLEDPVAEEDELKKVTSPHELTSAQNNSTESFANENRNLALQSKDETLNASGKQLKQSMSPAKKRKIESGKNGNGKANISPMIVKKTKLVLKKVATEEHQSPGRLCKDGPKEVSFKAKNGKSGDELDNDEKLSNSKEVTPKMQLTKTFVKESSKSSSPIAIREENVNRNEAGMCEGSEQRAIDIVDSDKDINGKEQLPPVALHVSEKAEVKAMIMIDRKNLKATVLNEQDVPCDDPEEELRGATSKGVDCKIGDTIEDSKKIDKMQLAENEAGLSLFAKDADSVVALNIHESSMKVTSALVTDSDSLKSNVIKQAHIPKESDSKYGEFAIEAEVLIENDAEIEPQQSKNAMIVTPTTVEHPSLASKPATPIPEAVSPKFAIENTIKTHPSKTSSQLDQTEKNEVVFSTSWNQSIKVTVNSSLDSPEFIDVISFKNRNSDEHPPYSPQNISSKKMLPKSVPRSSDSEDDDDGEYISRNSDSEDNDEDHNEFFDDEAMEASDDADSLNSSERAYLEANEIPEKGECIGSEDTSEYDSKDESGRDDDEDEMNSFIASESEIELLSANDSLMGSDNEVGRKKIRRRIFVFDSSSDEDDAHKNKEETQGTKANFGEDEQRKHDSIDRDLHIACKSAHEMQKINIKNTYDSSDKELIAKRLLIHEGKQDKYPGLNPKISNRASLEIMSMDLNSSKSIINDFISDKLATSSISSDENNQSDEVLTTHKRSSIFPTNLNRSMQNRSLIKSIATDEIASAESSTDDSENDQPLKEKSIVNRPSLGRKSEILYTSKKNGSPEKTGDESANKLAAIKKNISENSPSLAVSSKNFNTSKNTSLNKHMSPEISLDDAREPALHGDVHITRDSSSRSSLPSNLNHSKQRSFIKTIATEEHTSAESSTCDTENDKPLMEKSIQNRLSVERKSELLNMSKKNDTFCEEDNENSSEQSSDESTSESTANKDENIVMNRLCDRLSKGLNNPYNDSSLMKHRSPEACEEGSNEINDASKITNRNPVLSSSINSINEYINSSNVDSKDAVQITNKKSIENSASMTGNLTERTTSITENVGGNKSNVINERSLESDTSNKADSMLSKSFNIIQKSNAKSSIAISRSDGDNTLVADAGTSNLMIPKGQNMKKLPSLLEERKGRTGLIPLLDSSTNADLDKIIATAKKTAHRSKDNESLMETISKLDSESLKNITKLERQAENVPKSNENNLEAERTSKLISQSRLSDNASSLPNENSYEKRSTADPISSRIQSKIDEIATNESSSSEPQDELIASASNKSNSRSFKSLKRGHQSTSTNHEKVKINDKANTFIFNDQSDKMEQTKGKSKEKSIEGNTRLTISNKTMKCPQKLLSSSKNEQQTSKNISELEHAASASNNSYENYLRGTQSSKKSKKVSGDKSGDSKKKKFRLESDILKEVILNRIEEAKQKRKLTENVQKRNPSIPNSNQLVSTYVAYNIQQNKKKRKLSVNEHQPISDKKKKTNQWKETSSPHNKVKVVKVMDPKTSYSNKSTNRSEDTGSDKSKHSNGWQVSDISKKKGSKKLKILNEVQFGFQELPATPNKVNGFKVEPVTPKNIGWKVSSILSADQKEAPELSKKPKKSRPATDDKRTSKSPNRVWTSVGFFEVSEADNVKTKKPFRWNSDAATDFLVEPLANKKRNVVEPSEYSSSSALNFKRQALRNDRIKRESSKELLAKRLKMKY